MEDLKELNEQLSYAICLGTEEEILELIRRGADVNSMNSIGITQLSIACWKRRPEIVELLLENGADVFVVGIDGFPPIHNIPYMEDDAILYENIISILLKHGANIDSVNDEGETVLHRQSHCHLNKIEILLKKGANVNARCKSIILSRALADIREWSDVQMVSEVTPLHLACAYDRFKEAKLLIESGADANAVSSYGSTPLHYLCQRHQMMSQANENASLAKLLVENGAKINLEDSNGDTPLKVALDMNDTNMITFLMNEGAYIRKKWFANPPAGSTKSVPTEAARAIVSRFISWRNTSVSIISSQLPSNENSPLHHLSVCLCDIADLMNPYSP